MKAEVSEAIIHFTDLAHGEQTRRYTHERYIVHPIRVMQTCQQYTHDSAVLAAALLHDVLEDTSTTKEEIQQFLITALDQPTTDKAIALVVELTDVYVKKSFPRMNRKLRKEKEVLRLSKVSSEAQTIKYADVIDNAVDVVQHDQNFGYVYLMECQQLLEKMDKGNPVLHERAIHTVKECMDRVKKVSP